ncbi:MAG: tetratricopeptide repeat protein [Hyphomonadaceae bacterium]
MNPDAATFSEVDRLLRAGDLAGADRALALRWPDVSKAPAAALMMWSLVRRNQKRSAEAEQMLRRALQLAPGDARVQTAYAELMASSGRAAEALAMLRAAVRADPSFLPARLALARAAMSVGLALEAEAVARELIALRPDPEAWELLAVALRAQERHEDAIVAADEALKLAPGRTTARHGRAVALSRAGRNQEALAEIDALAARGVAAPALWLTRGVTLLNMTRAEEAEAAFADGVRRWPNDQSLQGALASVRWMRAPSPDFARDYEAAVAQQPEATGLRIACADLLRRAEVRDRAEGLLRDGLARTPTHPGLLISLGVMLDEAGRTAEGLPLLQKAVAQVPQASTYRANLACALLRLGRGDEALREILPARAAEPLNQEWICYETMALRQLEDPRYHELCDYERMVQPFDVPPPPGFANIEAFNQALRAALEPLHVLETHPLDQSLRHGSQTTRSLLTLKDDVVEAYIRALEEPIRAYIDAMGAPDPRHPLSGRKTGKHRLSGCWSVKLKPGGFHVNHLHPAGWISSAYYVSLPKVVENPTGQEGWIKFGEPRWPTPGCIVEKVVQPKEGRLVLFPSYMWHGTIPFSSGERLTAPFDVVPA